MTELYEAMSTLRAVRRLRPDPIPADVVERVVQAACWAPTGGNMQPWKVIVVDDPEPKRALAEIYSPLWYRYAEGYKARMEQMPEEDRPRWGRIIDAGNHLAETLADAPVILMFCADFRAMAITDAKLDRISLVGGGSVYPPVQNAMLACVAEGLGCTLTTLHCIEEDAVKQALSIPDPWATAAMVPIGYPVGRGHGPIRRRPPSEMAFHNSFGQAWPAQ